MIERLPEFKNEYVGEFATIETSSGKTYTGQITRIIFERGSVILTNDNQDTTIMGHHIESITVKPTEKGQN